MKTKEVIYVPEEEIEDYSKSSGSWLIKNETYKFVETHRTDGDGEWHAVIVQRKSDKKYFEFCWGYGDTRNYYEPEWIEVKPKNKTVKVWS